MTRATVARPNRSAKARTSVPTIRTFRSANAFLDSLTNYERVPRVKYNQTNFGLARTSRLLAALGNPQKALRAVHIAGTKGKGSTATMLAEMLRGCGHKVGLYTSPHLLDVRERIVVDGKPISAAAFTRLVAHVVKIAPKARVSPPTYFEVLTAAALKHFADEQTDIVVIETGMGGRLDATNVITPVVVGMVGISLDHTAQLGNTLDLIAREKAGVIKSGVPLISAPQHESVRKVLQEAAEAAEAPLRFSDENVDFSYRFEFSRSAGRHARICITTPTCRFEHLQVPLLGEHQATNCCLALNILDVLKSRGFAVNEHDAMAGLANVRLPGRMQMVCEEPRILVDGAHNAASVDTLMRAIGQHIPYDSMIVVFGCHKDKDIPGMIRRIQIGADKVIFTSTGSPRSADPRELAAMYTEHSGKMAQVGETLEEAMGIASSAITREDLICVTGSFYLVAEAIRRYSRRVL